MRISLEARWYQLCYEGLNETRRDCVFIEASEDEFPAGPELWARTD